LSNLHQNVHWAVRRYFLNHSAHNALRSLVFVRFTKMFGKFIKAVAYTIVLGIFLFFLSDISAEFAYKVNTRAATSYSIALVVPSARASAGLLQALLFANLVNRQSSNEATCAGM